MQVVRGGPSEVALPGLSRRARLPVTAHPRLRGRHVFLRPLTPVDAQLLYHHELGEDASLSWRFQGVTPSPEVHARSLWENVLATFVVTGSDTGSPLGVVSLYNPSLDGGVAFLAAMSLPNGKATGLVVEGCGVFLNHCFWRWPLRKVVIDANADSVRQYESVVGRLFKEEGRLRDFAAVSHGEFVDRVFLTLDRERWERERPAFASLLGGEDGL